MHRGLLTGNVPIQTNGNTYQRIEQLENFLYQLMEELRYNFANIDPDNYSENGIGEMRRVITQGMSIQATDGESSTTISLMCDGVVVSSQEIAFKGLARFLTAEDLGEDGETVIDGGRIKTGRISAITFDGCTFRTTLSSDGKVGGEIETYFGESLAGGIRLDASGAGTQAEQQHRLFLYTNAVEGMAFALKLLSAAGCSIEAKEHIYMSARGDITITTPGTLNLWGTVKVNGQEIGG